MRLRSRPSVVRKKTANREPIFTLRRPHGLDDARAQPNHGEAARIGFTQNQNTDGGWESSNEDLESEGGEKGWRGDN